MCVLFVCKSGGACVGVCVPARVTSSWSISHLLSRLLFVFHRPAVSCRSECATALDTAGDRQETLDLPGKGENRNTLWDILVCVCVCEPAVDDKRRSSQTCGCVILCDCAVYALALSYLNIHACLSFPVATLFSPPPFLRSLCLSPSLSSRPLRLCMPSLAKCRWTHARKQSSCNTHGPRCTSR